MKTIARIAATMVLLFVAAQCLMAGGGNRTGTAGAVELLIPVGVRDIGMGGAAISSSSGIEALFWNPAGVVRSKSNASLYFSHMAYIADIGVDYGAVAVSFGDLGTFALSIKSLSIGDIAVTTTDNPDGTGQTFSPQYFTSGLTYSRRLSERVSVGLTSNFVFERIAEVNASGVAFNVGVMYDNLADFQGLSLGVALKNIGPQMKFGGAGLYALADVSTQKRGNNFYDIEAAAFELPSSIEFGLGYRRPMDADNSLQFSSTFQSNNFSADEYRFGAEYSFQNTFFVRGGWDLSAQTTEDPASYIYGPSAGAGVHYNTGEFDIIVDYAFRHTEYFAGNHVVSILLGF